jgi:hypothetical protein
VFDTMSQWTWVAIAWLQVLLAYGGYLVYLAWRRRRLLEDDRAQRLVQAEAARGPRGRR